MRAIAIVVYLSLATGAAALAFGGAGDGSVARPVTTAADGSLHYENSRDGTSIFEAEGIGPGDGATGSVEITNTGATAGELTLAQHGVLDVPGDGGGLLSREMSMRIRDATAPGAVTTVYEGPLAPMPTLALGRLGPGQSRTFEFDAALPDSGLPAGPTGGDNSVQGASVRVGYAWEAGAIAQPGSVAPGPRSEASQPGSVLPEQSALNLRILRIRHAIRHRSLVLRARCSPSCRVVARLRFRVSGAHLSRARPLRPLARRRLVSGSQKLAFRLPRRLYRALRTAIAEGRRTIVRVDLTAPGPDGEQAVARGRARLGHIYPTEGPTRLHLPAHGELGTTLHASSRNP